MEEHRQYPRAPITEAIIDVMAEPGDGMSMDKLSGLTRADETLLKRQEKLQLAMGHLELRPGSPAAVSASEEDVGFKFTSDDGKHICQAKLSGFGFSRLAPYEGWQSFRGNAVRLWQLYRTIATPKKITRLAVRYINRVDIPAPSVDMKEYFLTSPEISSKLPQQMAGFFMQLRLPQEDIGAMLVFNQTIVPPGKPDTTSIVLDFDLFRSDDVPQDDEAIWNYFEVLHEKKNEVFEACITDRTRSLFQ
jgi:uncharacterized protein (TIGR04255 family)